MQAQQNLSQRVRTPAARFGQSIVLTLVLAVSSGCASTNPRDPLEPYNRAVYALNDTVDSYVLKPVAETYRSYVPSLVRTGVRNFFSNIQDVWIGANNMLQGKVGDGVADWMRVAINTTFGLGGIFDVAGEAGLGKHNEDFGQTLGWWGVPSGPYFVIPFFGPSTLRDAMTLPVDIVANGKVRGQVASVVDPHHEAAFSNSAWPVSVVSERAALLDATAILDIAALDRYAFTRDAFMQRRRSLVYDGNPPKLKDEDDDARAPSPGAPVPVVLAPAHDVNRFAEIAKMWAIEALEQSAEERVESPGATPVAVAPVMPAAEVPAKADEARIE